jgi:NADPH-dependent ferric siderophore reductase
MPRIPKLLTSVIGRAFFIPAIVSEVKSITDNFRLIELSGDRLKNADWIPGQMVQFHLGNLTTRAYTPAAWDSEAGRARFLIFLHQNGPGSNWAASLKNGDACSFAGPRGSLNFHEIQGPCVFFGDETSLAAARALRFNGNGAREDHYVFEVSSLAQSREALRCIELSEAQLVQRAAENSHLEEIAEMFSGGASDAGPKEWIFTGRAQSIQALRDILRSRKLHFPRIKVKAYWAEGKTGLD